MLIHIGEFTTEVHKQQSLFQVYPVYKPKVLSLQGNSLVRTDKKYCYQVKKM